MAKGLFDFLSVLGIYDDDEYIMMAGAGRRSDDKSFLTFEPAKLGDIDI